MEIKKIKPLFNRILTTAERYPKEVKVGSLIDGKKSDTVKEYQKVIAVGTTVKDIKVGDTVLINPTRYGIRKHQEGSLKDGIITDNPITQYHFNVVEIEGDQCLLLFDSDIDYILEDFKE